MSDQTNKNALSALADAVHQASALKKEADLTDVLEAAKAKQEKANAKQQEHLEKAKKEVTTRPPKPIPTTEERVFDQVQGQLEAIATGEIGSRITVAAWSRLVELLDKSAKKNVLDAILAFFVEHKNADFLAEKNALQGTQIMNKSRNLKLRLLYATMKEIASGTAGKNSINIGVIRNIFKNEDFTGWVAKQIADRR